MSSTSVPSPLPVVVVVVLSTVTVAVGASSLMVMVRVSETGVPLLLAMLTGMDSVALSALASFCTVLVRA